MITRPACAALVLSTAIAAVLLSTAARASDPAGAVFLRVGVGARSAGMGDADIVGERDASALYWNPAALGRFERREILLLHNRWLSDVRQEYIAGVFPYASGGIGVGANGMYLGNIPRFEDDVPLDEPQGDFGYYALAVQAGYGRPIVAGLHAGVSLKAIREQVDIEGAWTAATDIGLLYDTPLEGCRMALVIAHLGPAIRLGGVDGELPLEARAGIGYARALGPFHAEIHGLFRAIRALNPRAHFGVEAGARQVFLRAGLKLGYDVEDVSFGLGLLAGRLGIDYAFVPFSDDDLGESHRVSLSIAP